MWEDRESRGWATFVVVGPPTTTVHGKCHPVLLLTDARGRVLWHETVQEWEDVERSGIMRRVA